MAHPLVDSVSIAVVCHASLLASSESSRSSSDLRVDRGRVVGFAERGSLCLWLASSGRQQRWEVMLATSGWAGNSVQGELQSRMTAGSGWKPGCCISFTRFSNALPAFSSSSSPSADMPQLIADESDLTSHCQKGGRQWRGFFLSEPLPPPPAAAAAATPGGGCVPSKMLSSRRTRNLFLDAALALGAAPAACAEGGNRAEAALQALPGLPRCPHTVLAPGSAAGG